MAAEARLDLHRAAAAEIRERIVPLNTRRAFQVDWAVWEDFCRRDGSSPLTVSGDMLATFATWLATDEPDRPRSAPATITRRLAGILDGWKRAGLEIPHGITKDARTVIRAYDKHLRREGLSRGRGASPALTIPELRQISGICTDGLTGLRDRALLVLGFTIAARREILAAMNVEDVTLLEDEGLVIWVRDDKTGEREVAAPYGSDRLTCAVRTWRDWTRAAGIASGRAFRSIANGTGRLGASISGDAINDIIQKCGREADIPKKLTAHSMRSGLATESRRAGKDAKVIAAQGGWAPNSATPYGYMQIVDRFEDNAAKGDRTMSACVGKPGCKSAVVRPHDRCWSHLPHEVRAQIRAEREARWPSAEPNPDAEPACWSRPIIDEVRAGLESGDPLMVAYAIHAWDGGRCHLCGRPCSDPVEDHDHLTDRVRGWLCRGCNVAEGHHRSDGGIWQRWRGRPAYMLLGVEHYYGDPLVQDNAMRNVGL